MPQLSDKHRNLGFELSKDDNTSLILKYRSFVVCIIGSQLNVKDEILTRICDSYLEKCGPQRFREETEKA